MVGDFIFGFLIGAYLMARIYEPFKKWIKEFAEKHNGRNNNN
jgi:hypothetical protein